MSSSAFNLAKRLENLPFSGWHLKLLTAGGLGVLFDSLDAGIIAFILPALASAWKLSPQQMGTIGSAGLLGMAVGAAVAGSVADRLGRKTVFMLTLLIFGISTGFSALSNSVAMLLVLRFLTGFGVGGEPPVVNTLTSEFSPIKYRGRMIVLQNSFWAIGWTIAALTAFLLIPRYGWQIGFLVGAVPAFYVLWLRRAIPESVRYLVKAGRLQEAEATVTQIETACGVKPSPLAVGPAAAEVAATGSESRASGFLALWSRPFIHRTIGVWMLWFCIVFAYYGMFIWLPSIMISKGFTITKSFEYVLTMTLSQLPGYFASAYLIEKIGRKPVLVSFLTLSGVAAYFFGQAGTVGAILSWGAVMSFFNLGAWGVVHGYTTEIYPTRMRATGAGFAGGFGRVGGVLAPLVVGWIIAAFGKQAAFAYIFDLFTVVLLLGAAAVLVFGVETMGRSLEQISAEGN